MKLTGSQIRTIMEWCEGSNIINEAVNPKKIIDTAASQSPDLAKKATMAYLHKAWVDAGSPTDSAMIANVLKKAGVKPAVISSVYQTLKVDGATSQGTPAPESQVSAAQIKQMIDKLRPRDAQSLLKHVSALVKGGSGSAPKATQPNGTPAPSSTGTPKGTSAPKATQPKGTSAPKSTGTPKGTSAPSSTGTPKGTSTPKASQPKGRIEPKIGDTSKIGADDSDPSIGSSKGFSAVDDVDVKPAKGITAQRGKKAKEPSVKEPKVTAPKTSSPNVEPQVDAEVPPTKSQAKEKAALVQPRGTKKEKPAVLQPRRTRPSV